MHKFPEVIAHGGGGLNDCRVCEKAIFALSDAVVSGKMDSTTKVTVIN